MQTATSQESPRQGDSLVDHSATKQRHRQQIDLSENVNQLLLVLPPLHEETVATGSP